MKNCRRCGGEKLLAEFHKNHRMTDGHLNVCKQCRHMDAVAHYAVNREADLKAAAEWRAKNRERKLANDAAYRARPGNAEKQRSYNREYYKKNSEALKARAAAWSARNHDQKRETDAAYRAANREGLRAWHRGHRKTPSRAAAEKMKGLVRRALKKTGVVAIPFTDKDLEAKWQYWNACCWICGDSAATWDHVKPLTAGGAHAIANMRPACRSCNSAKNNKWPLPGRAEILGFCS